MTIYTKTGDNGTTGLQGDIRVPKSDPRIIAYGTVDEANAQLGIILSHKLDSDIEAVLIQIQNELFVAGSDLSNPNLEKKENRITPEMVISLEKVIDNFEMELTPVKNFILPGGNTSASQVHFARTIIRRAEICVDILAEKEKINQNCLVYLNRLSDLLFVLGRVINKRNGIPETIWKI